MSDEEKVVAALELLPDECWVTRNSVVFCVDLVGGKFDNGAEWTEEMCCLPCRLRAALTEPAP